MARTPRSTWDTQLSERPMIPANSTWERPSRLRWYAMRSPVSCASVTAPRRLDSRRLAVGQPQEVHFGGFQQRLPSGQEVPHVLLALVLIECCPVPVQLVEDPLARRAVNSVARVDERSRFPVA